MKKLFLDFIESIGLLFFRWKIRWACIPLKENYKVISLGLGQQSTCLYFMSSTGFVERADFAVFADTGSESRITYAHLKWMQKWQKENKGIPILIAGKRSLYKDLIHGRENNKNRFSSIPAFTKGADGKAGMLQRQCTEDYKTNEINKLIRKIYGIRKRKKTPATEIWLGITLEEMERAKYPRTKWLTFVYPFLNIKATKGDFERVNYTEILRRSECQVWLEKNNFPIPPKSACTFCPYQGDKQWKETKQNDPEEWAKLITLDESIRNSTSKGVKRPIYLHRSCKPLKDAELQESQLDMFKSECEGMCGV